ncbi:DUF1076 domain-containing protein, partial [Salmonella enterica subsp. enterica]|nr:DUF1076 domain-containing protein [Salmonella enterica subsp. enterica]
MTTQLLLFCICVPDNGVFSRTSLQSDVCCLYDSTALKELVSRR